MKTAMRLPSTEGAIWERIVQPEVGLLSRVAAQTILYLDFTLANRERMEELADKASAGMLTPPDRQDAESYNRVAHLLALLHSKARQSLRARKQR